MIEGRVIVYTKPTDAAALRVTDSQGSEMLEPTKPKSAYRSIQEPGPTTIKGGEGPVCVWFVWEDCKGECCAFIGIASVTATQEG